MGHKPLGGGDPQTPPPQGNVLITFDDGEASTYTKALPALTDAGLKATFYMIPSLFGTGTYITSGQAQAMNTAGMDMAQHGNTHVDFQTLTQAQIETELSDAKSTLDGLGCTRASAHVAYPFGRYDADVFPAAIAQSMKTGRTVDANNFTLSSVYETAAGVYLLPVYYVRFGEAVYSTPGTLNNVKSAVASAVAAGQTICLLFHSIVDSAPADHNSFLTADFVALLAYIKTLNTTVMTISEWYTLYKATYPIPNPYVGSVPPSAISFQLASNYYLEFQDNQYLEYQ